MASKSGWYDNSYGHGAWNWALAKVVWSPSYIVAREVDAPVGTKPVEWRLLTNRHAGSLRY